MNNQYIFIFLILFAWIPLSSQIIFSEDFEGGGIPADWTIESLATDGGWKVGTPGTLSSQFFFINDNGSARVAATNDDDCNCNKSSDYFITPAIDLTGLSGVVLKFDSFFNGSNYQGDNEYASIEVSTDKVNWTILEELHGHGSWDRHTVNLSEYVGLSEVYIGFKYDDSGGWLYGFAIDNISVEVPPKLDAGLADLHSRKFGEIGDQIPLKGSIFNHGTDTISSIQLKYYVDGNEVGDEILTGLSIDPFNESTFQMNSNWEPTAEGLFMIELKIINVNGGADENDANNEGSFESEIFEKVTIINQIDEYLLGQPVLTELAGSASFMDRPTDLDFFPILGKDELWVVNQRNENSGGSTLTISDATADNPSDFNHRADGNAWHFMALPTGIAFSDDNYNFATTTGIKDANHNNGTFTGPTLWSSDPEIYAQPSGGNGSHLDMLHGSPFCMGIAHEVDNVFWVYDNWNSDIVRYDFAEDHGPGNDDHSDAVVRRFKNIGIEMEGDIPNHMILDKTSGWLYFTDNGSSRVMRLDINSANSYTNLPIINETLEEHSSAIGFNVETIIEDNLDLPCGIEILDNRLLVSDYSTGDIIVYDMENDFQELGRIPTNDFGITGIKVGPKGKIWYTNREENKLMYAIPGDPSSVQTIGKSFDFNVFPNPSNGEITIRNQDFSGSEYIVKIQSITGQEMFKIQSTEAMLNIDISGISHGIYLVSYESNDHFVTKRITIQ